MTLDEDNCWRALAARDARFDGRFFIGVASTRVYCRPVCRVRAPRRENCRFFPSAAAAEVAGYRPCLRCRPELAPGHASIDAGARLAQAAVLLIEDGFLEEGTLESLAARLGVTDRHLRRVFEAEFGVAPVQYAQTQRLLLAKRLLTDTAMPVTDVAMASGFGSVRRFNALFLDRYRMTPGRLRERRVDVADARGLVFELPYRPPYAWDRMLAFLRDRAVHGVEHVDERRAARALALDHRGTRHAGWVEVSRVARKDALAVRVSPTLARALPLVLSRVRHVFDVGCDPSEVAAALGALAAPRPGLRLPGAYDGFELAVRGIVGQQISVAAARTLMTRLAARFGTPLGDGAPEGLSTTFPSAATLAAAPAAEIAAVGLPKARAASIVAVAQAVASGAIDLTPKADVEPTLARLVELPGIGPWTAQYVAMRALGWPDAFPESDLGVLKALGVAKPREARARAEAWRPWRAYAVIHLWSR